MESQSLKKDEAVYFPTGGKYLICGIAPGNSGTGRFLRELLKWAVSNNFSVISPMPGTEITSLEQDQIATIRDSTVIILHPQCLGLAVTERLINNNKDVRYYVLDNSFFCIKSYNHIQGELNECLTCLGNPSKVKSECNSCPIGYAKADNTEFLLKLQNQSNRISFFCQTQGQQALLKKHFGPEVKSQVLGMSTNECHAEGKISIPETTYNLVYHGEALGAKGAVYAFKLAEHLPEKSFLFPFRQEEMFSLLGKVVSVPDNCTFSPMRWESGLKEQVVHCDMVLVPSLWSAPVEGALIKSIFYNGKVGVFNTEYAFHNEVPADFIVTLNSDFLASAKIVEAELNKPTRRQEAEVWAFNYSKSVNLSPLFAESFQSESTGFNQGDAL